MLVCDTLCNVLVWLYRVPCVSVAIQCVMCWCDYAVCYVLVWLCSVPCVGVAMQCAMCWCVYTV